MLSSATKLLLCLFCWTSFGHGAENQTHNSATSQFITRSPPGGGDLYNQWSSANAKCCCSQTADIVVQSGWASDMLIARQFSFDLPMGATILSASVTVNMMSDAQTTMSIVLYSNVDQLGGPQSAKTYEVWTTGTWFSPTFSFTDITSFTRETVNSNQFGVGISFASSALWRNINVACFTIDVFYQVPITSAPFTTRSITSGDLTTKPITSKFITSAELSTRAVTSESLTSGPLTTRAVTSASDTAAISTTSLITSGSTTAFTTDFTTDFTQITSVTTDSDVTGSTTATTEPTGSTTETNDPTDSIQGDESTSSDNSDNRIGIIGGAAAGAVALLIILLSSFLIYKKKAKRARESEDMKDLNAAELGVVAAGSVSSISAATSSRFTSWEIDASEIKYEHKLGSGSFGEVFKAEWRNQAVAVKQVKSEVNSDEFLKEAHLMLSLRPHENVIQLLGVVMSPNICIVLRYCEGGSLLEYLRKEYEIAWNVKLEIMKGIAAGMSHLHREKIIHRDLAARNVLLNGKLEAVVSDFGFARLLDTANDIGVTKNNVGPVKHMAPESLVDLVYSEKVIINIYWCGDHRI
eukprot:TRINITY_DN6398_c0_g2_i2.p1 TRINITY_DN6398_c0_g2~~TRINITY_DN6398_c0_g2_i2.p1  ORF type:complete len:581 (+),score=69.96 TRINITY_DN6398_c0_g2_i2:508-2250(+)